MTKKLYDESSYTCEFDAKVVTCEPDGEGFVIVLDQTAFFPESGGQSGDRGVIGEAAVYDTQIKDGVVFHYTEAAVEVGADVHCELDWETRFRRMQNHTGEHICCGIAHRLWGSTNVGFHLGTDDVTFDLDTEISEEQVRELERLANEAVVSNAAVIAEFPEPEHLAQMEYRSKLELTENVRIVTIEGVDVCACCAPHVARTGEIGMIKLLEHLRWKGGTRVHLMCGFDALENYNAEYAVADKTGALLSVQHPDIFNAVTRLNKELIEKKAEIRELRCKLAAEKLKSVEATDGNLCLFEDDFSIDDLRWLCNHAPECGGMCACFSPAPEGGRYLYVISGKTLNMREQAKLINSALGGKGGGSEHMIQGSVTADRAAIEAYFAQ